MLIGYPRARTKAKERIAKETKKVKQGVGKEKERILEAQEKDRKEVIVGTSNKVKMAKERKETRKESQIPRIVKWKERLQVQQLWQARTLCS